MTTLAESIIVLLWFRLILCTGLAVAFFRRRRAPRATDTAEPSVSIVVPAYNEADDLADTLRSLAALDPAPLEIVVVDDGSDDDTAGIATRTLAGAPGAQVIRLPRNRGKAVALNCGIAASQGDLLATVDADTRLDPAALRLAVRALRSGNTGSVAMWIAGSGRGSRLDRIQSHEYAASLGFERAGQSVVDAIGVLPGAAMLLRRTALPAGHFSVRTRTEDADLTLELGRLGVPRVLAADARATTLLPSSFGALLAQRIRWASGHLQCAFIHLRPVAGSAIGNVKSVATYTNFLVITLTPILFPLALGTLALADSAPLLGLGWQAAVGVSIGLVYLQRFAAIVSKAAPFPGPCILVVEPMVMGLVGLLATLAATWTLLVRRKR